MDITLRWTGSRSRLAYVLAVNHDGSLVFITGESAGTGGAVADYATVCYDAVTGQQRWVQRYDNGDIDLGGLTLTVRKVSHDHVQGTLGDGKGRLSVETGSGNVYLEKL